MPSCASYDTLNEHEMLIVQMSRVQSIVQMPPPGMPGPPRGFPQRPGGPPSFPAAQRPHGPPMSQPQQLPGTASCLLQISSSLAAVDSQLVPAPMSERQRRHTDGAGTCPEALSADATLCCLVPDSIPFCRPASSCAACGPAGEPWRSFFSASTCRAAYSPNCGTSKRCAMASGPRYVTAGHFGCSKPRLCRCTWLTITFMLDRNVRNHNSCLAGAASADPTASVRAAIAAESKAEEERAQKAKEASAWIAHKTGDGQVCHRVLWGTSGCLVLALHSPSGSCGLSD